MKKYSFFCLVMLAFTLTFSACQKSELDNLTDGTTNQEPTNNNTPADSLFAVNIYTKMEVGTIVYDSIRTNLSITSWDKNNVPYTKEVEVGYGKSKVYLPKTHTKFQFKFQKWGANSIQSFTKEQIKEGDVINFTGTANLKRLNSEESTIDAGGIVRPYAKTLYAYNEAGQLKQIDYYTADASTNVLKFNAKAVYLYEAGRLAKVQYFEADDKVFGNATLTYNTLGKIETITEKKYDQTVSAKFKYSTLKGVETITGEYTFDNGNKMAYNIKYKNGNIVEDVATSSTSGAENGTYQYDDNINPYAQMNLYSLFQTNLSRNNNVKQDKTFVGSIPSNVPYKSNYQYDANGYPTELVKSYKTYPTNNHLFKINTVYKY